MRIVILGLSITSSWGNGHATTYRGLARALADRGHEVIFLERDVPWYRDHRDLAEPSYCETHLYGSLSDLDGRFRDTLRSADAVIVGSFTPEGVDVARWAFKHSGGIVLFYDIDTPVTIRALERGECEYLRPSIIPQYDAYLSFTGGPVLERLEGGYGAQRAIALYCSVDPEDYPPSEARAESYALGYLGTYSSDRQPSVDRFLVEAARRLPDKRFAVAGPQYPEEMEWPSNVHHRNHIPPRAHAAFYHDQAFALNVTRSDMIRTGFAPSVRLFEAAATATPVLSDGWPGLETFFRPDKEIVIVKHTDDVVHHLEETSEQERRQIGHRARQRVLEAHTPAHRAQTLEDLVQSLSERRFAHA